MNVSPKADGTPKISVVDVHHMVVEQNERIGELEKKNKQRLKRLNSLTNDIQLQEQNFAASQTIQDEKIESNYERGRDLIKSVTDNRLVLEKLETRINTLEAELFQVKGTLIMRENVVAALRGEINRLQQFTRRYAVIVVGIEKEEGERAEDLRTLVENLITEVDCTVTMDDVDKFHRNGPLKGKNQEIIIRFKSHRAKEELYRNRKSLTRRTVKIRPSLTHEQKMLLEEATRTVDEFKKFNAPNPPEYIFADVHGNIKLKLEKDTSRGKFIAISSIDQLGSVLQSVNAEENPYNLTQDYDDYN